MKTIQDFGAATRKNANENLRIIRHNAEEADHRREIQHGMTVVANTLKEFEQKVNAKRRLTEYIGGGKDGAKLGTMSDKTRMTLACTLATALSKIAKDNYALTSDEFVTQDEISLIMHRLVEMTWGRFISDKEKQIDWLNELTSIVNNLRRGRDAGDGPEQSLVGEVPQRTTEGEVKESGGESGSVLDDEPEEEAQPEEESPAEEVADPLPWEE